MTTSNPALDLSVIADFSKRPPGAEAVQRAPYSSSTTIGRRGFLKSVVGVGLFLGVNWLKLFPQARKAFADGYDWYDACPSYASSHDCDPGCGPSWPSSSFCDWEGWHLKDGYDYLHRPNECFGGWADGWTWWTPCGGGLWCHDGWYLSGYDYVRTICRYLF